MSTNVYIVKAMVFPVVMYWCKSQTIKKAERWRIDTFELWCWRRLLKVPWTTRRSNMSILKKINLKYALEGLMLKLKLRYFGHLLKSWLIKDPDAGKDLRTREGDVREQNCWMASLTQWTSVWASSRRGEGKGSLACYSHWVTKSQTELSDWTITKYKAHLLKIFQENKKINVTYMQTVFSGS